MSNAILVMTTVENRADGEKLARILLEKRVCGCAQLEGPVSSFYWWQGKLEKAEEYRLQIKSDKTLFRRLEETIKKNHPYETPEIIGVEIGSISDEYGTWLNKELNLD